MKKVISKSQFQQDGLAFYPDNETGLSFVVLFEYIDAHAVSKQEAFIALNIMGDRIRELNKKVYILLKEMEKYNHKPWAPPWEMI